MVFHPLGFRADGAEWIVGRRDAGSYVAVPDAGVRAIRALESGATVRDTRARIRAETGQDLDVAGFVRTLAGLGMVASIDGRTQPGPEPVASSLPRVTPRQVRWTLSPLLHGALLALALCGVAVAVFRPAAVPRLGDLLWAEHGTVVLLTQAALTWLLIFLHELAHLLTARAAGVPGQIRLGTRLHFLVAQTEVSGIWLADRRTRLTVYLAGIVLDLAICGAGLTAMALWGGIPVLTVLVLAALFGTASQLMVFMRTDLYFVLQDLTGCRNMFGDAIGHLRFLAARLVRRPARDPLAGLPGRERRALRWYAVLLVGGSGTALVLGVNILTQVTWPLLRRSLTAVVEPTDWVTALDAATTIAVVGGLQCLWAWAWWRRHGPRVRRLLSRRRTPAL
ncbi:hypothetical protein E1283_32330 [Streptomyces hainanensis]|uniref:PqqD family protein n=1 Tax=Streptomyces hainanensis TaxID=402648 RepID=A0A4R4SP76_9ACTN|nr:hypothetical protein E1283_32330 [Streptomyces hainanensis]